MINRFGVNKLFLAIAIGIVGVTGAAPLALNAQPIPVGDIEEDHFRLFQLLSDSTSGISFLNRPVWEDQYNKMMKEVQRTGDPLRIHSNDFTLNIPFEFLNVGIYDPVLTNTFNSQLPSGGNNEAAWYGRGFTSELKAGMYVTSKYVTLSVRPHFIWQQNRDFTVPRFIPKSSGTPIYTAIFPRIDMPFRFGPDSYSTFDWGNSSFRFHFNDLELGFGTEQQWWGPGIQNALMMSNNGPGLRHIFFGTRSPLSLPFNIGKIEFKHIGAWPKDSKYYNQSPYADRKRFMTSTNIIFSPTITPGLHLGFSRTTHIYIPDEGLGLSDLTSSMPFAGRQVGGPDDQNQLVSAYFRWVLPKNSAEIYGEYFKEDSFYDLRDLFMEPDHNRAYTIGAQKIIPSNWIEFFKINTEITSLVPSRVDEVRPQTYFYSHSRIRQGHTNKGQVLGAAIGPGSGSQYLGFDGYFTSGMLGLFIQRVEQNDFFHFEYYDKPRLGTGYKDIWRNRVNLNIGLRGHYKAGQLLMSGKLMWNNNMNYGRSAYGNLDVNFDTFDPNDITNWHFQISARYLFGRE